EPEPAAVPAAVAPAPRAEGSPRPRRAAVWGALPGQDDAEMVRAVRPVREATPEQAQPAAAREEPRPAAAAAPSPAASAPGAAATPAQGSQPPGFGFSDDDEEKPFQLPPLDLLAAPPRRAEAEDEQALQEKSMELESVLGDYGVRGQI